MLISIAIIKHDQQRYETCGDWRWDTRGNLLITVSDLGNWRHNILVAFHEFAEVMLCRHRNISQQDVDQFDIAYEEARQEGDTSEPGDSPLAPYNKEHKFATIVERLLAEELEVNWEEYEAKINSL